MMGPFFEINLDGLVTPTKTLALIDHFLISVGVNLANHNRIGWFLALVGRIAGNMQDLECRFKLPADRCKPAIALMRSQREIIFRVMSSNTCIAPTEHLPQFAPGV